MSGEIPVRTRRLSLGKERVSPYETLREKYALKKRIICVTAWDYATGTIAEKAGGVDVVLVSDSLSKVAMGLEHTEGLSLDEMIYHCRAVSRAVKSALLIADLPMGTYEVSPEQALQSAIRLVKEGRVNGVKLEGTKELAEQVAKISNAGIVVCAHVGLTPQRSVKTGRGPQGVTAETAREILADAQAFERAGASAIFMEAVAGPAAEKISRTVEVPIIGIGSGAGCSGQLALQSEILGYLNPWLPEWHKKYCNIGEQSVRALQEFVKEVSNGSFPSEGMTYPMNKGEDEKFRSTYSLPNRKTSF